MSHTDPTRPRIAVVGTGWWAEAHHIPSLATYEGGRLEALVDPDEQRRGRLARQFGVPRTYGTLDELLDAGGVDAVIVATPHHLHYPLARAALLARVHALVEKPLALTADHAFELARLAQRNSLHLVAGHTFQFTGIARRAHEIVTERAIGDLVALVGTSATRFGAIVRGKEGSGTSGPQPGAYADPGTGGGHAYSQLVHSLSLAMHLAAARAEAVAAFMDPAGTTVDLIDAISFRLRDGCLGSFFSAGTVQPGHRQTNQIRLVGSRGEVRLDLLAGQLEAQLSTGRDERLELPEPERVPTSRPARTLADLVAGRTAENPAPGATAAAAIEILEAAHKSATRGTVVFTPAHDAAAAG